MKIAILGCSADSISIVFDLLHELYSLKFFTIFINKDFGVLPYLPTKEYSYKIQLGMNYELGGFDKHFFGLATPKIKSTVYSDFLDSHGISRDKYAQLFHHTAYISPSSKIENAVLIEPHAIISSQTEIGFGVNIKRGSSIGHHVAIGEFCDINPGVVISGKVKIGKKSIIGSGSVIRDNVSIGENSIIGIGSIVTKNIPDNVIAFGNPCKVIKDNDR